MLERVASSESDGQDTIDAVKAPFLDHLIELRQRLVWALGAFLVMFLVCFSVAPPSCRSR